MQRRASPCLVCSRGLWCVTFGAAFLDSVPLLSFMSCFIITTLVNLSLPHRSVSLPSSPEHAGSLCLSCFGSYSHSRTDDWDQEEGSMFTGWNTAGSILAAGWPTPSKVYGSLCSLPNKFCFLLQGGRQTNEQMDTRYKLNKQSCETNCQEATVLTEKWEVAFESRSEWFSSVQSLSLV